MILQKLRKQNEKGFTLIELMIVIAIIGILAAIAIPNFIKYRQRGYDSAANADIKNAYTAAQAYFTDFPNKTIANTTDLWNYGYVKTTDVNVAISAGTQGTLAMTSSHSSGSKTYAIDNSGAISF